jgi:BASS family bile acid:Na+ symporter
MMTSQRNMGLMLAATGGALPDLVWLYFAVSQLPIYLSPQLLKPLAFRLKAAALPITENASLAAQASRGIPAGPPAG